MTDLISRTDAIDAVTKLCVDGYKAKVDGYFIPLNDALINTLSALPSARPTGEWKRNKEYKALVFCSECGMPYEDKMQPRDYCPSCGADMRGGEDE